jgi:hypothetical protein
MQHEATESPITGIWEVVKPFILQSESNIGLSMCRLETSVKPLNPRRDNSYCKMDRQSTTIAPDMIKLPMQRQFVKFVDHAWLMSSLL